MIAGRLRAVTTSETGNAIPAGRRPRPFSAPAARSRSSSGGRTSWPPPASSRCADGVRAVSLAGIAARAGIDKSALLRYFETREQIFLELTAREWRAWVQGAARRA